MMIIRCWCKMRKQSDLAEASQVDRARKKNSLFVAGPEVGALPKRSTEVWQRAGSDGLRLLLRGGCSTWSTSISFCTGASFGAPSTQHHIPTSSDTPPSRQHHLHIIITISSTQPHQCITMHTTPCDVTSMSPVGNISAVTLTEGSLEVKLLTIWTDEMEWKFLIFFPDP